MLFTYGDWCMIDLCLEGFFFGKISVILALTLNLAKEVQLFLALGIYSGIFAMYLQCPLKESRTAAIVFYVLCLLYVLSMASFIIDVLGFVVAVSNNFIICKIIICMQMRIGALSPQFLLGSSTSLELIFHIEILQGLVPGFCDLIAQCILVRTKSLYLSSVIHINLQRSSVVGSCGVKISAS